MSSQSKGGTAVIRSITANLMVESVDESLEFYRKILGFAEVTSVPNDKGKLQFAIVARDGQQIMFQEKENFCAEYPILATDKVRPSLALFFTVSNFSDFIEEVSAKTTLLVEEHATFYGTEEFAIADNNGYVLTFAESD
jgi:catechol 2,3-dioxygenase-like lactoylglutathione lyase family enzyme